MNENNVLKEVADRINKTADKLYEVSQLMNKNPSKEESYLDAALVYLGKALNLEEVEFNDTECLIGIVDDIQTVALAVMALLPTIKNIPPVDQLPIPKPKLIDPLDTEGLAAQAKSIADIDLRNHTALIDSVQIVLLRYGFPNTSLKFKTWFATLVDGYAVQQAEALETSDTK